MGRQIAALEGQLGVALFERTGRGLSLTPSGEGLLAPVRAMAEAAAELSDRAAQHTGELDGAVSISCSELYAAFLLPAALRRVREAAPGIQLEVIATNDTSDLLRREADIAVRSFRPEEDALLARRLGAATSRFYALPALAARAQSEGLTALPLIGFDNGPRLGRFLTDRGVAIGQAAFPLLSPNHLVQLSLAEAGLGAAILPDLVAKQRRELVPVPHSPDIKTEVWLTVHRDVKTSARLRRCYDILADEITKALRS